MTEGQWILLVFRFHFHDHLVFIGWCVDGRNLSRTKGIAERGLDLLNRHTISRGLFAIYIDIYLRCVELDIAVYILNQRQFPHGSLKLAGIVVKILGVGRLQSYLIRATRRLA